MHTNQILKEVNNIFIDVLDQEDIVLMRNSTADDVEDWDSLTNMRLIVAIEKHFNIKFTTSEIQKFRNVGEMCDSIIEKKK